MRAKNLKLILFFFFSLHAHAEGLLINIMLKNGTMLMADITEMPKISFENGIMSIGIEETHVDNIVKYTIENSSNTGVKHLDSSKQNIDISRIAQGFVAIVNDEGQPVHLYNMDGISLPVKTNRVGSSATIDFSSAPSGIYVLTIGSQSIKCRKQ